MAELSDFTTANDLQSIRNLQVLARQVVEDVGADRVRVDLRPVRGRLPVAGVGRPQDAEHVALDTQLAQVFVFGPEGELLRVLSRENQDWIAASSGNASEALGAAIAEVRAALGREGSS